MTTLRITAAVHETLRHHHLDPAVPQERVSYAFGRAVYGEEGLLTIVVADTPIMPADDCYVSQSGGHVAVAPDVLTAVLAVFARSDCDVILNIHDHWFSTGGTDFSPIDDRDDCRFHQYLKSRFEPMLLDRPEIGRARDVLSVAIVFDQTGLAARYVDGKGEFRAIDRVEVVGPVATRVIPNNARKHRCSASTTTLRHRDYITPEQQAYIAGATYAVVGCGGLGSIAAEAFFRLGGRRFVLFDHDLLEEHNLNRWQGGRPQYVGENKAELLARRLRRLSGGSVHVEAAPLSVLEAGAVQHLVQADVVLGCLDTHVARNFLNRFSIQYLVPYFDAGVNITAGEVVDFQSRFFAVAPGHTACALCSAYRLIDQQAVDRDLTDEVTAAARVAAGYVENQPEIRAAASAYALNLRAASTLVTEFTNWVCGFRPFATAVAEFWTSGRHQRSDRENHPEGPDPGCPVCGQLLGAASHAELPRAAPVGRTAQVLADIREHFRSRSTPPVKGETHGAT